MSEELEINVLRESLLHSTLQALLRGLRLTQKSKITKNSQYCKLSRLSRGQYERSSVKSNFFGQGTSFGTGREYEVADKFGKVLVKAGKADAVKSSTAPAPATTSTPATTTPQPQSYQKRSTRQVRARQTVAR